MAGRLAWGILGAGSIARTFARAMTQSTTGKLVAIGSRSQSSADRFADEFQIPVRHGSYQALLDDPAVQAVYIATPHPVHAQWAIKAAGAGKHILCEKPLGINHAEAMAIIEAAREHDIFLMEAFMYRCHPQTAKLIELIQSGAIGEVRLIEASFAYNSSFDPDSRIYENELAGGGILDVGCYPASMARLVAGAATGKPFADPVEFHAIGHVGKTGVDEYTAALCKFPGQIMAQLVTAVSMNCDNQVRIYGNKGHIIIPEPWVPQRDGGVCKVIVSRDGRPSEEIQIEAEPLYVYEIDLVARSLSDRQAKSPAMSWADTLSNMRLLDQWRESIGLLYDQEKMDAPRQQQPLSGKALTVRPDHKMTYGHVDGLDKPLSRLVLGVDNQKQMPQMAVMADDYFGRGGNAFDTAYIYGGGKNSPGCERLLGQWVKSRSVRQQVVIIEKGAHTPHCNPDDLTRQLLISLDRLGMDYVDIYMMHRDNPQVPVGEFIDVLNEHHKAGRIRLFGGSNWTIERIDQANAYARGKGLKGMGVLSNNFSLARMIEPIWPGCISSSDPESRAWLEQSRIPLLPWSSQSQGFFTGRSAPDKKEDAGFVRSWYSDDNFARKDRAVELARQLNVEPTAIALAYTLHQPFEVYPLIGPRTLDETLSSMAALSIKLTSRQVRWLNLESDRP
ncbi:MAG: aldo/keto reductase [Phycisphaerales bacterium]|nr:aldo/keto reductase [Phycisphaerales bacterium]